MSQAILITAYKNFDHLIEIVQCFDDNFEFYIHIDKKSNISDVHLSNLTKFQNVKLIEQKYKVNWGGFNHLRSILYLSEQALKNRENIYFHLITGHDFPIKNVSFFLDFFKKSNLEFMDYFNIPKIGGANNGNMDRIEYYNFYDFLDFKNDKQRSILNLIIKLQKRFGIKRAISSKMPKLYGGSTYWSLSRECLTYVLKFTQENKFVLNRFKYTLCAEEMYFQTIIMNSDYANKVANDNLRHIDWVARNGNNPAVLDETDYEKLLETNAVFARKFDFPQSIGLLNKIKLFSR
ncbi:MAG: hypothetical protein RL308_2291 [Bacteroidota bacterium]|jgi:hypothetical protein